MTRPHDREPPGSDDVPRVTRSPEHLAETEHRRSSAPAHHVGVPQVVVEGGTQPWTEDVRAAHKRVRPESGGQPPPSARRSPAIPTRSSEHDARRMERWMGSDARPSVPRRVATQDTPAPWSATDLDADHGAPDVPRGWPLVWAVVGGALVGLAVLGVQSQLAEPQSLVGRLAVGLDGDQAMAQATVGEGWTPGPWHAQAGPALPSGLRDPPPGTLPEAEKAFRELPASPADLPPVGGIGRSGIHVDRISTGAAYERGHCQQAKTTYSISARERVNVCIRVVHPREKEDVVIYWEKDGGTMRRSQIPIVPMHAYRTRAYLALRQEYVGHWTVRVQSSDGVELAQESFSVVE